MALTRGKFSLMVQPMATSKHKTTVAVLRGILGPIHGREENLATLASRSVSWVKKVSSGIEPLTEEAALDLQHQTGVSMEWLLNGDPAVPPIAAYPSGCFGSIPVKERCGPHSSLPNSPYTYEVFEEYRAFQEFVANAATMDGRSTTFTKFWETKAFRDSIRKQDTALVDQCTRVLEETQGEEYGTVVRWRLKTFLDGLATEFEISPKPQPSKQPAGKPRRVR